MPIITIIVGALLDTIGVGAFVLSSMKSYTALIPSAIGTILILLGALSMARPGLRKHLMHAAATLGLLGLLGSTRGLLGLPALLQGAEGVKPVAVIAQSVTAFVCLVFLALCVKSFIDARRKQAVATT